MRIIKEVLNMPFFFACFFFGFLSYTAIYALQYILWRKYLIPEEANKKDLIINAPFAVL